MIMAATENTQLQSFQLEKTDEWGQMESQHQQQQQSDITYFLQLCM